MTRPVRVRLWCLLVPDLLGGVTSAGRATGAELPGVTIARAYDDRGRLRKISFDDGSGIFRAWAELSNARLVFFIEARRDKRRSEALFGRDVVRLALREFGTHVRAIEGRWTDGTNRAAYDAARASGATKRAAAAATWTGRTLAPFGYTRVGPVRVVKLFRETTRVDCVFRKPYRQRCREALEDIVGTGSRLISKFK